MSRIESGIWVNGGMFGETGSPVTQVRLKCFEERPVSNVDFHRALLCCTWGADGAGMYEEQTGLTRVPAYKQQGCQVVE